MLEAHGEGNESRIAVRESQQARPESEMRIRLVHLLDSREPAVSKVLEFIICLSSNPLEINVLYSSQMALAPRSPPETIDHMLTYLIQACRMAWVTIDLLSKFGH